MAAAKRQRKLVLVVVDSLRADMLLKTVEAGDAPTFKKLIDRGELVGDCVSSFPSVTPVCTSEITTGVRPDRHLIPGMNWYHRAEERYVEYGSSFEATRAFGLFRSLYDTVYNLNMGHLNYETPTLFERLADAGLRTACTPFLIYRGRTRHEVGPRGPAEGVRQRGEVPPRRLGPGGALLRRALLVAQGRRQADARPPGDPRRLLGRRRPRPRRARPLRLPALLAARRRLLLPPRRARGDAGADRPRRRRPRRARRRPRRHRPRSSPTNAVIVVSDHAQSFVEHPLELQAVLGERWQVLQPNAELTADDQLAVGPSGRGAGDLAAPGRRRRARPPRRRGLRLPRARRRGHRPARLDHARGRAERPLGGGQRQRHRAPLPSRRRGVATAAAAPGSSTATRRRSAPGSTTGASSATTTPTRSPASGRRSTNPNAGDILVSLATGWECVDWGGGNHLPGGSHGSLLADRLARNPAHGRPRRRAARARAVGDQRRLRADRGPFRARLN